MPEIRIISELQSVLDEELAWRVQEMQNMRLIIHNQSGLMKSPLLRSAVPILYAHWEGFVKKAAISYSYYLNGQRVTFGQMKDCFSGLQALQHVRSMADLKTKIFASSDILQKINGISNKRAVLKLDKHITEIGNLNYDLFEQILLFLSIDPRPYSGRKIFIDEKLLSSRNSIAHGESLPVDQPAFDNLHSEVIELIRSVKTDIENAAVTNNYRK